MSEEADAADTTTGAGSTGAGSGGAGSHTTGVHSTGAAPGGVNARPTGGGLTDGQRYAQGMQVRRAVLSDAHVDRARMNTTAVTADWQDFITRVAWGDVWSRPGLDRRARSVAVITALIAGGHHDELPMHLRAGIGNGLTVEEIGEVILQSAIYCGVPAANEAFRIAAEVFAEGDPTVE